MHSVVSDDTLLKPRAGLSEGGGCTVDPSMCVRCRRPGPWLRLALDSVIRTDQPTAEAVKAVFENVIEKGNCFQQKSLLLTHVRNTREKESDAQL